MGKIKIMVLVSILVVLAGSLALAQEPSQKPPPCKPGFRIVEEIHYREVCHHVCKIVPEVKKKWVYCWKEDPFCLPKCSHKHHCDADCPHCLGPFPRKQLVKKEVVDKVVSKCVVEKITERVPYKVYRQVPCDPANTPAIPPPAKADISPR